MPIYQPSIFDGWYFFAKKRGIKMKKLFVWIMTMVVCMFLGCIPDVIGGNIETFFNDMMEVAVFMMLADKAVKWIFRKDDEKSC